MWVGRDPQAECGLTQEMNEPLGFDLALLRDLQHQFTAHDVDRRDAEPACLDLQPDDVEEVLGLVRQVAVAVEHFVADARHLFVVARTRRTLV